MINFIKGMAIGISNILPGISGGSIAVLLNIYEGILEAINNFFKADLLKKKNYIIFISQILAGALVGILAFSKIIEYLLGNFPVPTNMFFIGLIIASLPHILDKETFLAHKKQNFSFFTLGSLLTICLFVISLNVVKTTSTLIPSLNLTYGIKLFGAGFIAGGSMIVPGISGSLMLILLGEYANFLYILSNLKSSLAYIIILGSGIGLGIVILARIIGFLLKKFHAQTLSFILGLITFTPLLLFPREYQGVLDFLSGVIALATGFIIVLNINKFSNRGGK